MWELTGGNHQLFQMPSNGVGEVCVYKAGISEEYCLLDLLSQLAKENHVKIRVNLILFSFPMCIACLLLSLHTGKYSLSHRFRNQRARESICILKNKTKPKTTPPPNKPSMFDRRWHKTVALQGEVVREK